MAVAKSPVRRLIFMLVGSQRRPSAALNVFRHLSSRSRQSVQHHRCRRPSHPKLGKRSIRRSATGLERHDKPFLHLQKGPKIRRKTPSSVFATENPCSSFSDINTPSHSRYQNDSTSKHVFLRSERPFCILPVE